MAGVSSAPWGVGFRDGWVAAWPAGSQMPRLAFPVSLVPDGMMPPCGTRSTFRTSGNSRQPRSSPRWPAGRSRLAGTRSSYGDHVVEQKDLRREIADPWILLTAAALATHGIRLGTAITPVARRQPSKLAREVATLDRLTGGRMVLGAGLGAPVDDEYASFGDTTDTRVLAERLDEGLHALDLLWSGEPVTYRGNQITINDVVFLPAPVQRPRVPIWVGGFWPNKAPMRRAARWDGAIPTMAGMDAARPPE